MWCKKLGLLRIAAQVILCGFYFGGYKMIVVLKHGVSEEKKAQLIAWLEALGLRIHISDGEFQTVLGLIGAV